jgi:hypothetical protein
MTGTRLTAHFGARIVPVDIGSDAAPDPQERPVSAAARHLPDQRSR